MNVILLEPDDFCSSTRVRLHGRRFEHVRTVHRAEIGQELCVGVLNGKLGRGRVTSLSEGSLEMDISLDRDPPPPLPLTLLLALPRPRSLKKVLEAAAAMGVKRIFLMRSWRVEPSFWNSPVLKRERLAESLKLGLEQARDTVLPTIEIREKFKPFVEDEVPSLIANTTALVAHPTAANPCPHEVQGSISLAIGPEGGFIPYEIECMQSLGFTAVTLGQRSLRVEHAVPALLGRLFG